MHLIMDARYSNRLVEDEEQLAQWMMQLCYVIGMTPLREPMVVSYPFPGREGNAPSACLFLAESSITAHPYPEYSYLFLDVFSCKRFNSEKALDFIRRTLKTEGETVRVFERGLDMETGEPLPLLEL